MQTGLLKNVFVSGSGSLHCTGSELFFENQNRIRLKISRPDHRGLYYSQYFGRCGKNKSQRWGGGGNDKNAQYYYSAPHK